MLPGSEVSKMKPLLLTSLRLKGVVHENTEDHNVDRKDIDVIGGSCEASNG